MGISVDMPCVTRTWAEERGIEFPLLSDFQRAVVEEYGVKHKGGFSQRAYFVVDREGIVRAKKVEDSSSDQPGVQIPRRSREGALASSLNAAG
ncbi:MAG: redoxin domain-containing protein [Rubrobacter sp.]|nr:redoxin domain-containing protein [Rubrobacter sp.]